MVIRTLKDIFVGLSQGIGFTFSRREDFTVRTVFPASATIKH
jgi:hypothetical protein